MKKTQGITLVALVITIIILLILAGISIAQLTGNGLFENAKLAKEKTQDAQEKENSILDNYDDVIDGYLKGERNNTSSSLINNFKPIIVNNEGTYLDVTSNATTNNGSKIVGYAYLCNGKVKSFTENSTVTISDLQMNTEYTINVIAMDEDGKIKISSNLQVKTQDIVYLYKNGEKSVDLHQRNTSEDAVCVFEDTEDFLSASAIDTKTNYTHAPMYTTDSIDVTNINKIYVHFYDVNMSTDNVSIFVSACTDTNGTSYYPGNCFAISKVSNKTTNGEFTLELDVSSLSGNYNICFGGFTTKDFDGVNFNNNYTGNISYKIDWVGYMNK